MSDVDKTLEALASLCPQNIPKIENLPVPSLEIGDQCLLIWSDQIEVWKVKGFCADDGVDIVYDKFNAHMEVPRSELRLIGDFFNARQEEIDNLKAQLNNMEQCYIEKKKQVEACAALAAGWSAITWDKTTHWTEGYEEGCYHCSGQIEEALRGAND